MSGLVFIFCTRVNPGTAGFFFGAAHRPTQSRGYAPTYGWLWAEEVGLWKDKCWSLAEGLKMTWDDMGRICRSIFGCFYCNIKLECTGKSISYSQNMALVWLDSVESYEPIKFADKTWLSATRYHQVRRSNMSNSQKVEVDQSFIILSSGFIWKKTGVESTSNCWQATRGWAKAHISNILWSGKSICHSCPWHVSKFGSSLNSTGLKNLKNIYWTFFPVLGWDSSTVYILVMFERHCQVGGSSGPSRGLFMGPNMELELLELALFC